MIVMYKEKEKEKEIIKRSKKFNILIKYNIK